MPIVPGGVGLSQSRTSVIPAWPARRAAGSSGASGSARREVQRRERRARRDAKAQETRDPTCAAATSVSPIRSALYAIARVAPTSPPRLSLPAFATMEHICRGAHVVARERDPKREDAVRRSRR